jgi:predicted nucleotidyltransferase
MNGFVPTHVPVLRALGEIWGPDRFIVIGAAAVGYHIGMTWRGTLDLDLSVAAGIEKYEADLEGLGWRQDEKVPQRWYSPEDLIIDVVPAEPNSIRAGSFAWPDGSTMNLLGFRLAFADAIPVEIGLATNIRVASLRSIVVLKMSAYLDTPWERETDLADIAHILEAFVGPDADERWSPEVIELGLDYDDVSPYLLGSQLATVVDGPESTLIRRFLRSAEDDTDGLATLGRMARRAPAGWRDPDSLRSRVRAFGRELGVKRHL